VIFSLLGFSPDTWTSHIVLLQVMIDFQAAERQRLEEPASEIGLEPLCAMVCESFDHVETFCGACWKLSVFGKVFEKCFCIVY
jgi:hypothetical protein